MIYDHSVGLPVSEAEQVRARYARRQRASDPALPMFLAERERAVRRWLRESGLDPATARVLEAGCGTGGNLELLLRLGFRASNLTGVELLEDRLAEARRRLPADVRLIAGDAVEVAFAPEAFDVVLLFTVFSSLLDSGYRRRLAAHVWRAVKPGGAVLWYDFCFDNPKNPDVAGISKSAVRALFPEGVFESRRITLAPPLARAAVRLHPFLYDALNAIPVLRTHLFCWIRKEPR